MNPDDKNKPLKKSLKDRQQRFNDLLRNKQAEARARAETERQNRDKQPGIGAIMQDGTVYAGISPDTKKPLYAMPADAPLTMTFNEAADYAAKLDAHGHKDWRLPTRSELNVLFKNRAAIGGFNVSGSYPAGWYWSSTTRGESWFAWCQRFSNGDQINGNQVHRSSVRLVRCAASNARRGTHRAVHREAGSSSAAAKSNMNEGAKP